MAKPLLTVHESLGSLPRLQIETWHVRKVPSTLTDQYCWTSSCRLPTKVFQKRLPLVHSNVSDKHSKWTALKLSLHLFRHWSYQSFRHIIGEIFYCNKLYDSTSIDDNKKGIQSIFLLLLGFPKKQILLKKIFLHCDDLFQTTSVSSKVNEHLSRDSSSWAAFLLNINFLFWPIKDIYT